ncbi:hypothetical protein [Caballeronia sp. GAFFF3]|uniref:hypothetical protein n=1 Tax=Caballeronia sp. GAFFF3 TaxID=2921759 RepID=UPI0020286522|nr:hypothetical protein [Caballeronia sp. GAFFF3]
MVGDPGSLTSQHCGANREQQSAEEINAEIRRQNTMIRVAASLLSGAILLQETSRFFGLRAVDASAV